ncbi:hypothetical protein WN943_007110 [Citrus x changshan-huyou]
MSPSCTPSSIKILEHIKVMKGFAGAQENLRVIDRQESIEEGCEEAKGAANRPPIEKKGHWLI